MGTPHHGLKLSVTQMLECGTYIGKLNDLGILAVYFEHDHDRAPDSVVVSRFVDDSDTPADQLMRWQPLVWSKTERAVQIRFFTTSTGVWLDSTRTIACCWEAIWK